MHILNNKRNERPNDKYYSNIKKNTSKFVGKMV